jgi:mannose-1-phosphate guanylyltransferase
LLAERPASVGPTLERAARLIAPERLVAVLTRGHSAPDLGRIQRVRQPAWRGSAAEMFLPVLTIATADPEALVALFPGSELTDSEARFMSQVTRAVAAVTARPDLPVVIGTSPWTAEPGCPWIEPGPPIEGLESYAVRSVRRFVPRPSRLEAEALWQEDGLVNTGIIVAKARALIALGARHLPDVLEAFEPLVAALGTPEEALLSEAVYEQMPYAAAAHALYAETGAVAVLPVTGIRMWRERETPARVVAS